MRKKYVCFCKWGSRYTNRANFVYQNGGKAYILIFGKVLEGISDKEFNLPIFIISESGDRVFTDPTNNFGIDWNVICDLAGLIGVDTIHAGMWGGI